MILLFDLHFCYLSCDWLVVFDPALIFAPSSVIAAVIGQLLSSLRLVALSQLPVIGQLYLLSSLRLVGNLCPRFPPRC